MRRGRGLTIVVLALACALPAPALAYDELQNWLASYGQTVADLTNPSKTSLPARSRFKASSTRSATRPRRSRSAARRSSARGRGAERSPAAATAAAAPSRAAARSSTSRTAREQQLHATLYAPSDAQLAALGLEAPLAGIVYSPGFISSQPMYCWFGAGMANAGYVVMTYDIYGQGKSDGTATGDAPADLHDALDFFLSAANPFRPLVDPSRVGTAGHSMGAGAVQTLGSDGGRVKAISAQSDLGPRYTDTVPIQGQGADYETFILPTLPTFNTAPGEKLDGFNAARDRGVETQEIVIESASHLAWAHVVGSYTSVWSEPVALHYSLALVRPLPHGRLRPRRQDGHGAAEAEASTPVAATACRGSSSRRTRSAPPASASTWSPAAAERGKIATRRARATMVESRAIRGEVATRLTKTRGRSSRASGAGQPKGDFSSRKPWSIPINAPSFARARARVTERHPTPGVRRGRSGP